MRAILSLIFAYALCTGYCFSQSKKEEIIDEIWEYSGGKKSWDDSRFLFFTCRANFGDNSQLNEHLWDRSTGDYRFETTTPDKKRLIVLFNIHTQKGTPYINQRPVSGSEAKKYLETAYKAFVHDSFWLLAPLELDNTVTSLQDPEMLDGKLYQVIHARFSKKQAPVTDLWLYVNPETGKINQWKVQPPSKKGFRLFKNQHYKDLGGGLRLATVKTGEDNNSSISYPIASVLLSVEPDKLIKP